MKLDASWPEHLYLVPSAPHQRHDEPTPATIGSKAYNLLRMANIGLTVPPALVIGTHYSGCSEASLDPAFQFGLPALEAETRMLLDDSKNPLIVSIRSGAPVSMPGMMATLLNIGLSDATLPGLLRQTGNPRLVWDSYRRLIASYAEVVMGLPAAMFEDELTRATQGKDERHLDFSELRDLTRRFQALYFSQTGHMFPQCAREQIVGAVRAIFASWNSEKACTYRRINQIDASIGTAVTIQRMVFGNSGNQSGSGVGFTRDPTTGKKEMWVDFLANAQGEDVVSGRRNAHGGETLATLVPAAWRQLESATQILEREFADMQDFEFTVENGALYLLQTRAGKRTSMATAKIALDLLDESVIDEDTAIARTRHLTQADLCRRVLSGSDRQSTHPTALASAISACTGIVSGEIAFDEHRATDRARSGASVILVRQDADTHDIAALESSVGLLTQRGARTSHAAVVARQLGKVCLVGCATLRIDSAKRCLSLGPANFVEGDILTLNGNDGLIYKGKLAVKDVPDTHLYARLQTLHKRQVLASSNLG